MARLGVLVLIAVVAGCGFGFVVDEGTIEGTTWRAVSIESEPPVAGTEVLLRLGPGNVSGTAGCNAFTSVRLTIGTGSFKQGVPIEIVGISADSAVCDDPEVMRLEAEFLEDLGVARQLRLEDGTLIIEGPEGRLRFEQVRTED